MSVLQNGTRLPDLQVQQVGGGTLSLPEDLAGSFGVVLVYRGSWCPYCNAQLAGFSRAEDRLTAAGIKVAALSVDNEATSQALVDKHHLGFPVGHSADVDKVAETLGSYTTTTRGTYSPPASSWPLTAHSSRPCIPPAPSGAWSPTTSSG